MPYDIQTVFGTIPGQISPAEQQAHDAHMAVLRSALSGGGGGRPSANWANDGSTESDPFFAKTPAPVTGLEDHNRMVDRRQQATAGLRDQIDLMKPDDYLTATQHGDMARAQHGLDMGNLNVRGAAQQELMKDLGIGGGPVSGPANAPAGARPIGLGGTPGNSDDQLMRMAILGGLANGGAMPDVGAIMANRGKTQMAQQEHDLRMQELQMQLAEAKRKIDVGAAERRRQAGEPQPGDEVTAPLDPIEEFLPKSGLGGDLGNLAKNFSATDTKMFGWDPTEQDLQRILTERDTLVQALVRRGYDRSLAKQQANRIVQNSIGNERNDVNAGWTKQLLGSL